jgi:hypothetical protein
MGLPGMQQVCQACLRHPEGGHTPLVAEEPSQDTCLAQQALEHRRAVPVAGDAKHLQLLQAGEALGCTGGCQELQRVHGSEVRPQLVQLPHPGRCPAHTCRFCRP